MSFRSFFSLRNMYAIFDQHPRIEAFLEVAFNIIVGFAPFFIIALAKSQSSSEIFPTFWSFFSGGELVIFLFSACAAILWLTFLRSQNVESNLFRFVVLTIVVFGILYSGVVIGDNVGFKDEMSAYNQNTIFTLYVSSVIIWGLVSIFNASSSGSQSSDPTDIIDRKYLGKDSTQ